MKTWKEIKLARKWKYGRRLVLLRTKGVIAKMLITKRADCKSDQEFAHIVKRACRLFIIYNKNRRKYR